MQKGMQILHPFLVVHLAAHVSNTNIRRFRRIRFRRHCIRHRITEEESASSSRFPPPLHPHPLLFSAERSISTAGEKKNDPDNRIASTSVIC